MTEPITPDLLRRTRFFEEATEAELQQIAAVARLEAVSAATVLFREGDRLNRIFLVTEGRVSLELPTPGQGARRVYTVGPGELLGWSPVLSQQPMTATARALTAARVIAIDAGQVLALCHHDSKFGFGFMRRVAAALARRLEATRLQLLDIYRNELPAGAD
jgi:CRP-like cAMP-binding protein